MIARESSRANSGVLQRQGWNRLDKHLPVAPCIPCIHKAPRCSKLSVFSIHSLYLYPISGSQGSKLGTHAFHAKAFQHISYFERFFSKDITSVSSFIISSSLVSYHCRFCPHFLILPGAIPWASPHMSHEQHSHLAAELRGDWCKIEIQI